MTIFMTKITESRETSGLRLGLVRGSGSGESVLHHETTISPTLRVRVRVSVRVRLGLGLGLGTPSSNHDIPNTDLPLPCPQTLP